MIVLCDGCEEKKDFMRGIEIGLTHHPSIAVPLAAAFCFPLLFSRLRYDPSSAGT
jgi:hypothetical protein